MDTHKEQLSKLCRICGKVVILKKGYITAKSVSEYSNIIFSSYEVDIELEDECQYPKSLCNGCKRKLDRIKSITPAPRNTAFEFKEHSHNDCEVCSFFQRKSKPSKIETHIKVFDDMMLKYNFARLKDSFYKLAYTFQQVIEGKAVVKYSIVVQESYHWDLYLYSKLVPKTNSYLVELPEILNDSNIENVVSLICNLTLCPGIEQYDDVIDYRLQFNQPFVDDKGITVSIIEDKYHNSLKKESYTTIRSVDCIFFTKKDNSTCLACYNNKPYLRNIRSRMNKRSSTDRVSDESTVNMKYLDRDELVLRLKNAQKKKREAIAKTVKLSVKVADMILKEGEILEKQKHDEMLKLFNSQECSFEPDSPQWLLWQQQKEQASKKNSRSMRWHPLIIRWCLSIYHTSPAAYKQISSKKLQFMKLPHINTLKKYTNFTQAKTGINPDIISQLIVDAKLDTCEEYQREVVIAFDEMRIKSDLVYRKSTGQLIGFTELGDTNDELRIFERGFESDELRDDFATYVLVYMVRGVFTSLCYPFAYYSSLGFSSNQLYPNTLKAITVLERVGFKVRSLVSDGASPNRKTFKLLYGEDESSFAMINPHDKNRKVYCMSDVPHLVKTTRNCFENSFWNSNTRNMHFEKQDISWRHIIDVYEWDLFKSKNNPGLRKMYKVKEDHVKLSPRGRMSVQAAAQVLSKTVGNTLISQNLHYTKSTIKFVTMFDKVFDCLNVSKFSKQGSKAELKPYKDVDDWRFKFLEEEFIEGYLEAWENEVHQNVLLSKEEQARMLLSPQTRLGWKMSVISFVNLAKELLQLYPGRFILSEHFNQDPVEEYFGRQRRRGGCNDNPTLAQFGQQDLALNVMNSNLITDLRGNTRGRNVGRPDIDINDMRLPPVKKAKK